MPKPLKRWKYVAWALSKIGENRTIHLRLAVSSYLSSLSVSSFVTVTMSSFSVTPIPVTVTLSTRRPVTIPATGHAILGHAFFG